MEPCQGRTWAILENTHLWAVVVPIEMKRIKKKTLWGTQGVKPPEENSCRAFRSTNLPPICTHMRFGVHAVTPLPVRSGYQTVTCKVMFLFEFDVVVSEAACFFCIEVCYVEMCSEFCIEYIVLCMHFHMVNSSISVAM